MQSLIVGAGLLLASALSAPDATTSIEISRAELAGWREMTGSVPSTADQALADEIVWHHYWANRLRQSDVEDQPSAAEVESRVDLILWRLAARRWEAHISEEAAPPNQAEIESAVESRPKPVQRWQLSNILLEYPTDASPDARQAVRTRLEELRQRAQAGEDFGELAQQFSDSQTRIRNGRMGSVKLADLKAGLREAVAELNPGDISPVLDLESGAVLLHCTAVQEPKPLEVERLRERIKARLWRQNRQKALAKAVENLELEGVIDRSCRTDVGGAEACLSNVRLQERTTEIRRAHLSVANSSASLDKRSESERLQSLEGLALRFLAARSAQVADGPTWRQLREAAELRVRATLAIDRLVRANLDPPTEQQVRDLYEARPNSYYKPARFLIDTIEVPIRKDWSSSLYANLEIWGAQLESGEIDLDDLQQRLGGRGVRKPLQWQSSRQVFALGKAVETAVLRLEPGATAGPLQESRSLYFVHLVERTERRRHRFEEVQEGLAAAVLDREVKGELRRLRPRVLEELEWTIVE